MNTEHLSVAIIAGGNSRRFGSCKLEARFEGQRLLDIALDLAGQLSSKKIIVANRGLPINFDGMPVFFDEIPESGPLGGVYTALKKAGTNWVAMMPADMPLLSKEVYQYLIQNCSQDIPVVAESEKGLEPLVSIWPKHWAEKIETFIQNGRLGIYQCLQETEAKIVDCSFSESGLNQRVFENINWQEDLKRISR